MKYLATLTFGLFLTVAAHGQDDLGKRITYKEFIDAVAQGRVQHVEIWGISAIGGELHTGEQTTRFITARDATTENDPLLMSYLEAHSVSVAVERLPVPSKSRTAFTLGSILISPLNFILTVVLLLMMLYQIGLLKKLRKEANQPPQPTAAKPPRLS